MSRFEDSKVHDLAPEAGEDGIRNNEFEAPLSSGPVDSTEVRLEHPTKDEVRHQLEASEARADVKFAQLEGRMDLLVSKLDSISATLNDVRADGRSTRSNIWMVGIGLAALILATVFGLPSVYNMGAEIRDVVRSEVKSQVGN